MADPGRQYPRPCEGVYYWEQPDQSEAILVKSMDQSQILNTTGRLIWSLCDGAHNRQEILKALKDQFEVEENRLAMDVDQFLNELIDKGYLCFPG